MHFFRYFLFQFFFFHRFCCVSRFRYQFCKIEINKLQLKDLEETTLIRIFLQTFFLMLSEETTPIDLCPFAAFAVIYYSSSPYSFCCFYSKAYKRIKKSFLFVNLLIGHEENHKMQINRRRKKMKLLRNCQNVKSMR